jgi:D-alanyl-D-alanine carboxypeptidase
LHLEVRRLRVILLAASLAISSVGGLIANAPAVAAGGSQADLFGARLQQIIRTQRIELDIPGVSAAVIFGDGSRWAGQSGKADVATKAPVTASTPFVVGSITKTFVAALVLKLVEDGVLGLDDPLSNWLPDYPNAANITIRQLLSHTSGVFDYFDHPDYASAVYGHPDHAWTPDEILATFQHKPYFAPGGGYHYSNTNYVLLGLVAEAARGSDIADQLRTRFWQPLGLDETWIQSEGPPPAQSARGYLQSNGRLRDVGDQSGYRPTRSAATVAWSAGDVVSTADDIASWVDALYGGSVLTDASLAEMLDFDVYAGDGNYGLGTMAREYRGFQLFGHTGSLRGYVAAAWYVPSSDATFVVLTNRGRTTAYNTITHALMDEVLFDTTAPSAPTGIAAVAEPHRYVQVTWQAATDEQPGQLFYRVIRNGSAIGTWTSELALEDRAPRVGSFRYSVRARDAAGNKSSASAEVSVTTFR